LLFRPAAHAHTPAVVGTGPLLSSANALNALTDGTVRLIGAPLGGVLFALAGVRSVVLVDVPRVPSAIASIWRPGSGSSGPTGSHEPCW
jgi:hypothetical protein